MRKSQRYKQEWTIQRHGKTCPQDTERRQTKQNGKTNQHRTNTGVLDATLFDKVRQLLATGREFSPGTPVSCNNKTDRHNMTEILLKVALITLNQTKPTRKIQR